MSDTSLPGGNPRRDPLAARMLKSLEWSQDDETLPAPEVRHFSNEDSLPIPKIRHRGNAVPPCSRDRCKICSRHFLSPAARRLLQSQNDYIFIAEEAAKQNLGELSQGIKTNWLRLREYSQQTVDAIPSLKAEMLQECVDTAFPGLLSDKQLANIRYKRHLGVNNVCDINDGLKLPDFWTNMTVMEAGVKFIVEMIKDRSSLHPGEFVAVDNSELQLGWTSLLFRFTTANVFVNLSPASYGGPAISTPVEPSVLHSTHIFTYERGILILERQKLLYQGLADVAVRICKDIAASPFAPLSPVEVPPSADRPALMKLQAETASHICRANSFLDMAQADVLKYTDELVYINNTKYNADAMDTIKAWLLDVRCPPDLVFCSAVSIHIDDRLHNIMSLHKLRHTLRRLHSAAKARLDRNGSKTKLMEIREQVELDLADLMKQVACHLMKQNKYFGWCLPVLWDHGGDYVELLRCNSDHISNGCTRTIWHLFGLIELRAPVSDTIDLTISEVINSEGQFRPGVVQEFIPWLELCKEVVDTIETMCPCYSVLPKSSFAESLLNRIFSSCLSHTDLQISEELWNTEGAEDVGWAVFLWTKMLLGFEGCWEVQGIDDASKQSLRRILNMRAPPKKPRKRKGQTAPRDAPEDTGDAELETEQSNDVGPQASRHNPARSKAQRMRVQNRDPLAHLFHVNESLSKFGISEGFRWGTAPTTPRPSQFEDDSETCSSRPRTAKRWQAAANLEDRASPTVEQTIAVELPKPEPIVFADEDLYDIWRQVFPLAGEAGRGNARSRIKWHELRRVLVAEPLSMAEIKVAGIVSSPANLSRTKHCAISGSRSQRRLCQTIPLN